MKKKLTIQYKWFQILIIFVLIIDVFISFNDQIFSIKSFLSYFLPWGSTILIFTIYEYFSTKK
jgi:hypothetical protein